MSQPRVILIALGANLPHQRLAPPDLVASAMRVLSHVFSITHKSELYHSPAWPNPSEPPFINAVVAGISSRQAVEILHVLHTIEAAYGRRRTVRNAPRTLDLDLLAVGDEVYESPLRGTQHASRQGLHLPHPGLAERDFVLAPLAEILPDWRHPITGLTAKQMLARQKTRTASPI